MYHQTDVSFSVGFFVTEFHLVDNIDLYINVAKIYIGQSVREFLYHDTVLKD